MVEARKYHEGKILPNLAVMRRKVRKKQAARVCKSTSIPEKRKKGRTCKRETLPILSKEGEKEENVKYHEGKTLPNPA